MAFAQQKKPSVFVGSSTESLEIAYAVQENLEHDAEVTVWTQGLFEPSRTAIQSLLETVSSVDFAIFIFARDDVVKIRRQQLDAVRDNVIFELGMFIAVLGVERTFIVAPASSMRSADLRFPTDIVGLTPVNFNDQRSDGNLTAALGPACARMRRVLRNQGLRIRKTARRLPLRPKAIGISGQQESEPVQTKKSELRCSKVVHFVYISSEIQEGTVQTRCRTIRYWHNVVNLDARKKPHRMAYFASTSGLFLTKKGDEFFGKTGSRLQALTSQVVEEESGSVNRRTFLVEVEKTTEPLSFGVDYLVEGAFLPHHHPKRKDHADKPFEYFAGTPVIPCDEMVIMAVVPEDGINPDKPTPPRSALMALPNMTFREWFYNMVLSRPELCHGRVENRSCKLIDWAFIIGKRAGNLPESELLLERLRSFWPDSSQFTRAAKNGELVIPKGYVGLVSHFSKPDAVKYGCLWWRER